MENDFALEGPLYKAKHDFENEDEMLEYINFLEKIRYGMVKKLSKLRHCMKEEEYFGICEREIVYIRNLH